MPFDIRECPAKVVPTCAHTPQHASQLFAGHIDHKGPPMLKHLIATLTAAIIAMPLWAGEAITYPSEDDFDDTMFSVESAILTQAL
jgi:hypothetical protein